MTHEEKADLRRRVVERVEAVLILEKTPTWILEEFRANRAFKAALCEAEMMERGLDPTTEENTHRRMVAYGRLKQKNPTATFLRWYGTPVWTVGEKDTYPRIAGRLMAELTFQEILKKRYSPEKWLDDFIGDRDVLKEKRPADLLGWHDRMAVLQGTTLSEPKQQVLPRGDFGGQNYAPPQIEDATFEEVDTSEDDE